MIGNQLHERNEVLGRLAASDVASLKHNEINATSLGDEVKAFGRIREVLGVGVSDAKRKYTRIIKRLREADLTINFLAYKFFNTAPQGPGYSNIFERAKKGSPDKYMRDRDDIEEKLFDYSDPYGQKRGSQDIVKRIKSLGSFAGGSNADFQPGLRPRYAALNYAGLHNGAASMYGLSYVVLKPHIKHNATFVHTDSFNLARDFYAGEKVANYHHLHRLVVNMDENMLRALDAHNAGQRATFAGHLDGDCYIETQLHSGVNFYRDIEMICIAQSELNEAEQKTRALPKPYVPITKAHLKYNFEQFGRQHGIRIAII